jgi:C-terminal processing protease CtpA/Prc
VAYNKALDVYPTDPSSINDDFSFDPLVTYNTDVLADTTTLISNQSKATQSPLFEPQTSKNSYTDELQRLPRDHIFAPPGKLGVAIDIFNGQPVVQKIRKGSPITGMLQEGDIILAIDDVDISCMSLAEVTFLMVKNMERVRRITFVRRNK